MQSLLSTHFLFLLLVYIFIHHLLLPKFNHTMFINFALTITNLNNSAWNFLFHHSKYQNLKSHVPENEKGLRIRRYEHEPVSEGGAPECVVCLSKIEEGDEIKELRAICKYCQKEYLADSKGHRTSNLLSHLTSCRKYPHRDVDNNGQQTLSFQSKKDGDEGVNLVAMSFSVEAARRALAEMIVLDELPFMFVEGEGFKRFCAVLQPKFKNIPSRVTIARTGKGLFVSFVRALCFS
ncbi:unnamed protein product [Camellia sinensis]